MSRLIEKIRKKVKIALDGGQSCERIVRLSSVPSTSAREDIACSDLAIGRVEVLANPPRRE
jgi:hypothetical protein